MPASRLSRGGGVGVVTSALAPPTPIKNALSPVTLQPYCATIRHIRDTGTGAWGQGGLVTLQPPCYTDVMRQQSPSAGGQKMSTDTMTALLERYGWRMARGYPEGQWEDPVRPRNYSSLANAYNI